MDEKDVVALADAYGRINDSLNERFEQDIRLYIPMEGLENLKKMIYHGEYDKLVEKYTLKKYSAEVLANVWIKNAWLMRKKASQKDMDTIFNNCDMSYLSHIMEESIFDNKIEMPRKFRSQLIISYLKRLDANACKAMLESNLQLFNNPEYKAVCIYMILKDLPIETRYNDFTEYINRWPNILQYEEIVDKIFSKQDINNSTLYQDIFTRYIATSNRKQLAYDFWMGKINIDGAEKILLLLKEEFRRHASDIKYGKMIITNILPLLRRFPNELSDTFAEACMALDLNTRENIAQRLLQRFHDKKVHRAYANAFEQYGIKDNQDTDNELADIDQISDHLDNDWNLDHAIGYLIISFDKQYRSSYRNSLQELYIRSNDVDAYDKFIVALGERRLESFPQYMAYAVRNVDPGDHESIKKALKVLEDNDYIRSGKPKQGKGYADKMKAYNDICDFIRMNDFNLFKKLTR